jgi:DNA-directed RNA polymerase subunit RPC12/RpoP
MAREFDCSICAKPVRIITSRPGQIVKCRECGFFILVPADLRQIPDGDAHAYLSQEIRNRPANDEQYVNFSKAIKHNPISIR